MSEYQELYKRGEQEGFTEGLVYRMMHVLEPNTPPEKLSVCTKCGWYWAGLNRCLNPECKGFCTWGRFKGDSPTSWIELPNGKIRPRMPGEPKQKKSWPPDRWKSLIR